LKANNKPMQTIIALFDAPVPTASAVAALKAADFGRADVLTVPRLDGITDQIDETMGWLPAGDNEALARALVDAGVPTADASAYVEGVRRGCILLAVQSPTLSVPVAMAAIEGAAPADLATHRARWAVNPDLRYEWASVQAPVVDQP
jgi:hypothetical protein